MDLIEDLDNDLFDLADGKPVFNPFAGEEEIGIERDRWDRPLILPPDGAWSDGLTPRNQMADGRRPYQRLSSLSKSIDPGYGLALWKLRHCLLSIARRPDLQHLLCGLTYADGKEIDAIADEALIRAKDDDTDPSRKLTAAHRGTAFHQFTTPGRPVIDPIFGPLLNDYSIAAEQFAEALAVRRLEIVSSEQFVVNDVLASAGTYDHLVRDLDTGFTRVLDIKTGKMQWLSHVVQLEGYAGAQHYDPASGDRTALHEDFDPDSGFIAATDLSTGRCVITRLDLTKDRAGLSAEVHRVNTPDEVKRLVLD